MKQTKLPHHFALYVPKHLAAPLPTHQLDAYTLSAADGVWTEAGSTKYVDSLFVLSVWCDDDGLPGITGWIMDAAQHLLDRGELAVFAIIDGTATILENA